MSKAYSRCTTANHRSLLFARYFFCYCQTMNWASVAPSLAIKLNCCVSAWQVGRFPGAVGADNLKFISMFIFYNYYTSLVCFRFSPEQLGITASTALVWTTIEILILLLSLYIMNISTSLKLLDLFSYCGYKYVGYVSFHWFNCQLISFLHTIALNYVLHCLWKGEKQGDKQS